MGFEWSVSGGIEALSVLAGVRFDRLFTELDAIVESYTKGLELGREMFPDVHFGPPRWAAISYGHVNCLGSTLIFPVDSEVAHTPVYGSLEDGIQALGQDVDFTQAGMFPFYLDLWEQVKEAFPDHKVPFTGFGSEGPITTAWLLRGHSFFTDIYEHPNLAKEYLRLVTASIIKYNKLLRTINGEPEFSETGTGIADDGASMIPPNLWPELVMPYLEQYFTRLTSGSRSAHIEDLCTDHLPYLDALRLDSYDPSVSAKLTPALILKHCHVPFTWRLTAAGLGGRTPAQVEHWVLDAAAQGAPAVRANVWRNNCTPEAAENMRIFINTAKTVKRLLEKGCPRERLLEGMGTQ
jgi:Uroporphyrinogen decarboxylase (URO-D)